VTCDWRWQGLHSQGQGLDVQSQGQTSLNTLDDTRRKLQVLPWQQFYAYITTLSLSNVKHSLLTQWRNERMLRSDKLGLHDTLPYLRTPRSIQLAHGPRHGRPAVSNATIDRYVEEWTASLSYETCSRTLRWHTTLYVCHTPRTRTCYAYSYN